METQENPVGESPSIPVLQKKSRSVDEGYTNTNTNDDDDDDDDDDDKKKKDHPSSPPPQPTPSPPVAAPSQPSAGPQPNPQDPQQPDYDRWISILKDMQSGASGTSCVILSPHMYICKTLTIVAMVQKHVIVIEPL